MIKYLPLLAVLPMKAFKYIAVLRHFNELNSNLALMFIRFTYFLKSFLKQLSMHTFMNTNKPVSQSAVYVYFLSFTFTYNTEKNTHTKNNNKHNKGMLVKQLNKYGMNTQNYTNSPGTGTALI